MANSTVIIPNYNGIQYIDQCLRSLYAGTVIPRILVVDNGSKDGSRELVQERYKEVQVIAHEENTGFCQAVNEGIREAQTKYVILLNNDTVADARMVEKLEQAIDRDARSFSAAAQIIALHEPDRIDDAGDFYSAFGWAFARGKDRPVGSYEKPGRIFSACAAAAIYRRELFEEVGYFDENHFAYLEDVDIGYRANIYGYSNRYTPDAKVFHAGSGVSGSRHNAFKAELSARNSLYLVCKNMPFAQKILNLPFLLAGFLIKILFFAAKGMGGAYLRGLKRGALLCLSPEGKKHKVRFKAKNLKNYIWIQGRLWAGLIRK